MRTALLAVVGVLLLSACGSESFSSDDENRRFKECINAGGSFWVDGRDWGCDMPGAPEHE